MKATIVPADGASGLPFAASVPASQYTNAGMIEKIEPMIMKNQRPTIAWRIWSFASLRFWPRNFSIALACWPNVFDRRMPDTLSVSSVVAVISASDFCVSVDTSRRTLPTR